MVLLVLIVALIVMLIVTLSVFDSDQACDVDCHLECDDDCVHGRDFPDIHGHHPLQLYEQARIDALAAYVATSKYNTGFMRLLQHRPPKHATFHQNPRLGHITSNPKP